MTKGHHESKSGIFRQYLFMVSVAACAVFAVATINTVLGWGEFASYIEMWLLVLSVLFLAFANAEKVKLSPTIEKTKEVFVAILLSLVSFFWMFWASQIPAISSAQTALAISIAAPVIYVFIFINRQNNTMLPAVYPLINTAIFCIIACMALVADIDTTGKLLWFNFLFIILVYIAIPLCLDGWLAKSKKVN